MAQGEAAAVIVHLRAIQLCLCLGLPCLALPVRAQSLPDSITEIRVDVIQVSAGQIQKVLVSDLIQGKDARKFVARWNSLKRVSAASDCIPHPLYRFSFYEDKAKFYSCAAICFDCHTIFPLNPEKPNLLGKKVGFEDSDASHHLRKTLAQLFPGRDPGN